MQIPEIFAKCEKLVMSKRHDYTSSIDNHENFKRSAKIASWFERNEDKSYAVLIGTKLARLASLLVDGKKPNNESVEDSFLDLINYCALWMERCSLEFPINQPGVPLGIRQEVTYTCQQCKKSAFRPPFLYRENSVCEECFRKLTS